jgi:hypothetical protein
MILSSVPYPRSHCLKIAKILAALAIGALALFAFGRFFLGQLGGGGGDRAGRGPELAGVIEGPPPGYEIVDRGMIPSAEAAAQLAALLDDKPGSRQMAVRFERAGGGAVYWMVDRGADRLEERSAGASGTRMQTLWPGHLRERLRWAQAHGGDPAAPGLPPAERHNLYH